MKVFMLPSGCPGPELLGQLAKGTAAPALAEEMLEHVDSCPACDEILAKLEAGSNIFSAALAWLADCAQEKPRVENADCRIEPDALETDSGIGRTGGAGPSDIQSVAIRPDVLLGQGKKPQAHSSLLPEQLVMRTRYFGLQWFAKGGMGELCVARDESLGRNVAIKFIQPHLAAHEDSLRRFFNEAEITSRLDHPGVVPVYGLMQDGHSRPCYAMRLIEGESLSNAIKAFHGRAGFESLEFRQLLQRFINICQTIAYAHSRGVIHRDVKPANVMLGKYGETLVIDWGLAKLLASDTLKEPNAETISAESSSTAAETVAGTMIGTPQYMSPEQAIGHVELIGPRSDVYSLGATLYSITTGNPPFDKADVDLLQKVASADFPPPRKVKPNIPRPLEAICLKAMARDPDDRYASASELANEIERWLADEPVTAWQVTNWERVWKWIRHPKRTIEAGIAGIFSSSASLFVQFGGVLYWLALGVFADRPVEWAVQWIALNILLVFVLFTSIATLKQRRWALWALFVTCNLTSSYFLVSLINLIPSALITTLGGIYDDPKHRFIPFIIFTVLGGIPGVLSGVALFGWRVRLRS
jgi:serine/threonine protein kinase